MLLSNQVAVNSAALERAVLAALPAKPSSAVKVLMACAAQLASPQPGKINFITLLSPVCAGHGNTNAEFFLCNCDYVHY